MRMAVSVKIFCFHDNVASNFSSLFFFCLFAILSGKVSKPSNEECQKSLQPKKCICRCRFRRRHRHRHRFLFV